jgi:GH18 family chitinase
MKMEFLATLVPYSLSNMDSEADNGVEIQDILKDERRKIDVEHDKQAAVKYFKYDENQWISYDDRDTFKQKVEWANNLGCVS